MKDENLEQGLKNILSEEQEVPLYLTVLVNQKKPSSTLDVYTKWLFVISCVLLVIEEISLYQLYFINKEIFIAACLFFGMLQVVVPIILYLFKSDITHFIINQRRFLE